MYFSSYLLADCREYAEKQGLNPEALSALYPAPTTDYVGYEEIVKALNQLGKALNDPVLGIHIGEQISLRVTASVDEIMLHSNTLEASMQNAIEYSKVISDALECSYRKTQEHFAIIYEESPNWKVQRSYARKQIMDLTLLCNVRSLDAYTNHQYTPAYISFSTPKPKNLREHYRLFNCRLKFSQPKSEVVYERHIFDKHSKSVRQGLLESLQEKVAQEIANLPSEHPLIREVKKCLLNHKPERLPISELSKLINMSPRSLQRKLGQLGTNFKAIEHELQLKLAKTYLEEQQESIDEISYLLGFSESSAFIRFFKSLTSMTPKDYQRSSH